MHSDRVSGGSHIRSNGASEQDKPDVPRSEETDEQVDSPFRPHDQRAAG